MDLANDDSGNVFINKFTISALLTSYEAFPSPLGAFASRISITLPTNEVDGALLKLLLLKSPSLVITEFSSISGSPVSSFASWSRSCLLLNIWNT